MYLYVDFLYTMSVCCAVCVCVCVYSRKHITRDTWNSVWPVVFCACEATELGHGSMFSNGWKTGKPRIGCWREWGELDSEIDPDITFLLSPRISRSSLKDFGRIMVPPGFFKHFCILRWQGALSSTWQAIQAQVAACVWPLDSGLPELGNVRNWGFWKPVSRKI